MALRDLAMDAAGHDVARSEFGRRVHAGHEAAARLVDEDGAFAAQGFGGERRGIAADIQGRRMELYEFGIGDHGARTRRHAQTFAARFRRIGCHRIKRAEPACREHDGRRAEENKLRVGAGTVAREETGDAAVFGGKLDGVEAFHHRDGRLWRGRLWRRRA